MAAALRVRNHLDIATAVDYREFIDIQDRNEIAVADIPFFRLSQAGPQIPHTGKTPLARRWRGMQV